MSTSATQITTNGTTNDSSNSWAGYRTDPDGHTICVGMFATQSAALEAATWADSNASTDGHLHAI